MRIQIQNWDMDRLILSESNPRTHSPEQVAQIAASIQEFGFVNPILAGPDGTIIAGEGRIVVRYEGSGSERFPEPTEKRWTTATL